LIGGKRAHGTKLAGGINMRTGQLAKDYGIVKLRRTDLEARLGGAEELHSLRERGSNNTFNDASGRSGGM